MREIQGRAIRWLLALAAVVLLPAGAWATPVTYGFSSGTVQLSLEDSSGNVLSTGQLALNGNYVTFDSANPSNPLPDFSFTANVANIMLSQPVYGYDSVSVDVALTPGSGYTSVLTASNPPMYSIAGGPVNLTGSITISDGTTNIIPATLSLPSFTADANLSGGGNPPQQIDITQANIGGFSILGHTITIMANVTFTGLYTVPEPAMGLLLLAALGVLAATRRWRAHAS